MPVTNPDLWLDPRRADFEPPYEEAQAERLTVFKKIEPVGNWKGPICATIDPAEFDDCSEAAKWFTGAPLTQAKVLPDGKLVVTAPGYYVTIGS